MTDLAAGNPLDLLPSEITLRILDFTPVAALASLTRVSKAWHHFIDDVHQDAIYSATHRIPRPEGVRDFSFLNEWSTFSKCFEGAASWKDICKRHHLLKHNWNTERPTTRESIIQVGNSPIWRFKVDFKRRLFMSTSQAGGFVVTDMDSGKPLWSRTEDEVRSYAHLEYDDGTIVWDRHGDALEMWKTGLPGLARGEFRQMAVLDHNSQTRGFHLFNKTLCVSSSDGVGHVYDMTQSPPRLTTRLEMEHGAIGHLYQDNETVVYSFGNDGYYVFRKTGGALLYHLDPSKCTNFWHIKHPHPRRDISLDGESHGPTANVFPPGNSRDSRLTPLYVEPGPLPKPSEDRRDGLNRDEWGAGIISDDLFVGISRNGRVLTCPRYSEVVSKDLPIEKYSCIIECESEGRLFELGGWLAVKDNRITFEIQGRIYVVALDKEGKPYEGEPKRASYSMTTSSAPQLSVPVSMMAIFDDCIMTTYTTLGWRQPRLDRQPIPEANGPIFPTKTIRILCLAPETEPVSEKKSLWSLEDISLKRRQMRIERLVNLYAAPIDEEPIDGDDAILQILEDIVDIEDDEEVIGPEHQEQVAAIEDAEDLGTTEDHDEEEVYFTASELDDEADIWDDWSDVDDESASVVDGPASTPDSHLIPAPRPALDVAPEEHVDHSDEPNRAHEPFPTPRTTPDREFDAVEEVSHVGDDRYADDSGIYLDDEACRGPWQEPR